MMGVTCIKAHTLMIFSNVESLPRIYKMNQGRKEIKVEITTVNVIITLPYYKFMFRDQNPHFLGLGLLGTVTTKNAPRKEHFTSQCIQSASIYG